MEKMNGVQALKALLDGKTVEGGMRLYRYDTETNQVKYSDDNENWKPAKVTINEFLKWGSWQS